MVTFMTGEDESVINSYQDSPLTKTYSRYKMDPKNVHICYSCSGS